MQTTKEKQKNAFKTLEKSLGLVNVMQVPRLVKIVVGVGTGSFKDKKKNEIVVDRIAKITGQKAAPRGAKKSIASFKSRQGDVVGYQVTLRGARMQDFLDRLINIALPRTKDFKGLSTDSIDEMGNLTLGIKEHTIFPETADEDIKDVFGLAVTVVTTAKSKKVAREFLTYLGFPFKK
ncbi:MAG: 50S ribosomal protein L5 [Candidatus Taylorbacteria bacterium RIFCSPHIGHO2_02_FULL_46_13]|uniref:Large ribosomal subunit protein uL5 n=1 Tax=Candidatus Taylorbacteria bacterium RIFCSPHIGHO2_02_FULL_46_13 TaxID=1802312 RepID=A0A1G2MQ04_9BACT|nr:MAG: 50S ribosomal protein L5 [Candidatus Taylorbacteria bacterium RIFCSPHIGHO2_02_FULL_46_13]